LLCSGPRENGQGEEEVGKDPGSTQGSELTSTGRNGPTALHVVMAKSHWPTLFFRMYLSLQVGTGGPAGPEIKDEPGHWN
jgi:hypothetical protein